MPKFLFLFSQVHSDFRGPEFKAVCDLFNISFDESLINKNVRDMYKNFFLFLRNTFMN